MRLSGRVEVRPSMLTLFRPRLRSWEDRVAVQTLSSFAFSSGAGQEPAPPAGAERRAPPPRGNRRLPRAAGRRSWAGRRSPRTASCLPSTRVTSRPVVQVSAADFNLDDVARRGDGGAGRGAGEDDVALFEGEQLGQVGDEPGEREEQVVGGVVLDQLAVVPGADPQCGGVDGVRRDQARAHRA